jgi:DNA invertase Pin-like site-specific DNA recombinase
MARGKFVSYLRVSTQKQGTSGLGLEAQRKAVLDFLDGGRWELVSEHVEIESGKRDDRPKLAEALALCRLHKATLVIAKLDRLSRDAHFLLGLEKELQKAGLRFVAADMPEANELTVHIMAVVAQAERKAISKRTKEALAAAKARGKRLGNPQNLSRNQALGRERSKATRIAAARQRADDLAPIIAELRADGRTSLRQIAAALNERGITTARGGSWSATQASRLLAQVEASRFPK